MQRKKERKRARDMDRDHTFDLPDLTEDFWKTVVFAQEDPPSGMGGPGCVCLLSKEGKEYIFGFEETPFYKSTELFPIFETTDERIGYRHKYKAEDHGWKYLEKENALIREDILDEYSKAAAEAKREKENFWHFYAIDLAGRAIGVEHLERYDYIGSVLYRERMDREMATSTACACWTRRCRAKAPTTTSGADGSPRSSTRWGRPSGSCRAQSPRATSTTATNSCNGACRRASC